MRLVFDEDPITCSKILQTLANHSYSKVSYDAFPLRRFGTEKSVIGTVLRLEKSVIWTVLRLEKSVIGTVLRQENYGFRIIEHSPGNELWSL